MYMYMCVYVYIYIYIYIYIYMYIHIYRERERERFTPRSSKKPNRTGRTEPDRLILEPGQNRTRKRIEVLFAVTEPNQTSFRGFFPRLPNRSSFRGFLKETAITEPKRTEPGRVRKTQAEPRRTGKNKFTNRTEPSRFLPDN